LLSSLLASWAFRASTFFLLGLQLAGLQFVKKGVEALEAAFPKTPVPIQPDLKLLERRGPQGVDPALGVHANVNESSFAEDAQVFRDLGLAETQAMDHVSHGPWAVAQEFDDMKAVGLGQGLQRCDHGGL
jgi:hypothetical protein